MSHLLPGLVLNVGLLVALAGTSDLYLQRASAASAGGGIDMQGLGSTIGAPAAFFLIMVVLFIVVYYLQSVGYAAATYSVTRRAGGVPVTVGEALSYGLRRSPGLFGWTILFGLGIGLGFLACVLPGIYLFIAWAMFGPVLLFEGGNPLARSFRIFNGNRGQVLGRLAMTYLLVVAGGLVTSAVQFTLQAIGGGGIMSTQALPLAFGLASAVITLVLSVPIAIFQFGGVLLTYTEQRGIDGVDTRQLVAELG
ncbi:hypothetical protein F4553_004040 [Allocatelliglobosispora scoriae]|uniref:Glycerophosphoryl diester phosphodiesterase membrane domain-containing protein n=1 Tax=Allocatelliglobosispora scoriae TaxID=643052 RepID=A0A841BV84_9ACTN|nr:hypothetical protein [Allocatelliglobosispora scoriae]MBB5870661.1 hypothetical protein [Allocatelliglobosispora scoriae]